MNNKLPLNKLIILYILYKVDFTINTSILEKCVLENEYTDYFSLQQDLGHLININYIDTKTIGNRTNLLLTDEGKSTIKLFTNHIPIVIKEELIDYFKKNSIKIKSDTSIECDVYNTTSSSSIFTGAIKENNKTIFEIKIDYPTLEMAENAMKKWRKNNNDIYKKIMESFI